MNDRLSSKVKGTSEKSKDTLSTDQLHHKPANHNEHPDVPNIVYEVLQSPGRPLSNLSRAFMEPGFGYDFSRVRLHSDTKAQKSTQSINALAYTVGCDIVLNPSRYSEDSAQGKRILAHELAHVVQRQQGRVSETRAKGIYLVQEENIEREANGLAAKAIYRDMLGLGIARVQNRSMISDDMSFHKGPRRLPLLTFTPEPEWGPYARGEDLPRYPTCKAYDFDPDDTFYELLAHEFSYRNDLDGKVLYRAYQVLEPNINFSNDHGINPLFSQLPIPGMTPSIPLPLKDNFALMSNKPEISPSTELDSKSSPLYYSIHKMEGSDLNNDPKLENGLAAYYFIPSRPKAPKIVAFRGTEPALIDFKEDLSAGGVGWNSFSKNKQNIEGMLNKVKDEKNGERIVVTGHSLGGALAQWATATFPDQINETVTFNSPGISKIAAKEFQAKANKPTVRHYITRGDIVSTVGESSLPGKVTVLEGSATRKLEEMINSGKIELIGDALVFLEKALHIMPESGSRRLPFIYAVYKILTDNSVIEDFSNLSAVMVKLHGQRLLRISHLSSEEDRSLHERNKEAESNPEWTPLAIDIKEMFKDTGYITVRDKSPGQTNAPEIEKERKSVGDNFAANKSLELLFYVVQPMIKELMDNLILCLIIDMNYYPITYTLAKIISPILRTINFSIKRLGGLKCLFESALHLER